MNLILVTERVKERNEKMKDNNNNNTYILVGYLLLHFTVIDGVRDRSLAY